MLPILWQPHPPYFTFQNTCFLWPLLMDIYKIFRNLSTKYVKKIKQKKFKYVTPTWGNPSPLIIKHMISRPITNQSLQNFQRLVTYLPDMQWLRNNLKYVPHPGQPHPPIFHISIYMISLAITNGYLQNF